ncbi:homoserine O-succinyltransferase [Novosphingobium hassiacum]|uniref:Homoserine O-acetyltransferase n=1 Tax=Novosphingobium hassiacum TaxID=173676 RepID=A0A7W5ZWJ0_9SPHN|nr:homoserine O-succinyltransferase [Novosphingobium hassiacum]MBB3859462.1 homoserine O-succinyltransferase [Novosphingobium hassiacum]
MERRRIVPIRIADNLPARRTLEAEAVIVMSETEAARQDIRPMRIALLNLMPDKITTETQIARLLGATPLQVELELVRISDHVSKNTSAGHISSFYRPWEEVRDEKYDGLIVTGAPVETIPFEEVAYWDELRRIFDWSQTNVHRTLTVCWGAMAALHHFHGIEKHELPTKAAGVFRHLNRAPASPWMRGLPDVFDVPVSRWSEVRREDLPEGHGLAVLAESPETGLCLIDDPAQNMLHMFNHLEYDTLTLAGEYARDEGGYLPRNYFPGDDPAALPVNSWRGHGHLLFGNWINEVYQTTAFDLADIGK